MRGDGTLDAAAAGIMMSRLVLAIGLLIGGCDAPTSVMQPWRAPISADLPPMHRVLVLAANMEEPHRRTLEASFVNELSSHGVSAQPSYALFAGEPPEQAQITRNAYDGMLVASIEGIENERRWNTSLWEFRSGGKKLVWSTTSKALTPANATDLNDSITKVVVRELTHANYIPPANVPSP